MKPLHYLLRVVGRHAKALGDLAETIARIHEIENSRRLGPDEAMEAIREELKRYSRLSALHGAESGHEVDRSTGERKPA